MTGKDQKLSGMASGYELVGLGGTFAAAVVLFMLGGWFADRWLGLTPLLTLTGTVIGAVLGFLNVYWKIQADVDAAKAERAEKQGHH